MTDPEADADERRLRVALATGRLLQGGFLAVLLFGVAIIAVVHPPALNSPFFITGAALITVVTVASLLPWMRRLAVSPWATALPVLDFVGFAIVRADSAGGVTNPLMLALTR